MKFRTGRHNRRTIYQQNGDEPSGGDEQVGTMDTPVLGERAVAGLNAVAYCPGWRDTEMVQRPCPIREMHLGHWWTPPVEGSTPIASPPAQCGHGIAVEDAWVRCQNTPDHDGLHISGRHRWHTGGHLEPPAAPAGEVVSVPPIASPDADSVFIDVGRNGEVTLTQTSGRALTVAVNGEWAVAPDRVRVVFRRAGVDEDRQATEERTALVLTTVEQTLRTATLWLVSDKDRATLRDAAEAVKLQGADEVCCPVCEEMECDAGCPLETLRTAHDG